MCFIYLTKYNIPFPLSQAFLFPLWFPLPVPPTGYPYLLPLRGHCHCPDGVGVYFHGIPIYLPRGGGYFVYPFSIKSLACCGGVGYRPPALILPISPTFVTYHPYIYLYLDM